MFVDELEMLLIDRDSDVCRQQIARGRLAMYMI